MQESQYAKCPFNITKVKRCYLIGITEFRISAVISASPLIKTELKNYLRELIRVAGTRYERHGSDISGSCHR
jgi:hypothetical protein